MRTSVLDLRGKAYREGDLSESRSDHRRCRFIRKEALLALLADAPHVDCERFRSDVDAFLDQDPTPRG
jgi:hypothetical protein